jgi:outer membrane protein assembly factor BamB
MSKLAVILVAAVLGACGGASVFRLSSDENNAFALTEALRKRTLPAQPTPTNTSGQPRVFAVAAGGATKTIIAYDLTAGNVLWKTDADVKSRISVGGDFIVAVEGKQLVARDQTRGAPRWKVDLGGELVGLTADRERAYLVTKSGSTWYLAAYDGGNGGRLWKEDASGQLGAPAAHGGVVYVPFLSQWLSILDGRTGKQLTRLRGLDEQISTLRVTSDVAYYGSRQGMFRLDERSVTGKRDQATYGQVKVPPQLERTSYSPDAYDPIQQGYTAADRARVLWSSVDVKAGPMKLVGDGFAVHYFRYLFGFGLNGEMRWAYSQPRVELVASEHTGNVIVGISTSGDIVALDPQTGGVRAKKSLGINQQVIGATFDADGWAPSSEQGASETVAALVSIARDHDARFDRVKELAVISLAKQPGPQITGELLAVLSDGRAPQRLKDTVVDLLTARRDPAGLPVLTEQLAVHTDYIKGTEPDALAPVAKAIAGLGAPDVVLDPKHVGAALAALQFHLDAATTSSPELTWVIAAMAAIGHGAERPALISHFLLYHTDDDLGGDAGWQKAIVAALAGSATPADRAVLAYVAADPRTKPGLAALVRDALGE